MARPVAIPAVGTVAGLARKEFIYDTEGQANGTPATQVTQFTNYTSFATAALSLTKQFGRDTNLAGGQGGLPQAHQFLWYKWRCKFRSVDLNTNSAAAAVFYEQVNRLRQLTYVTFQLAQSRYITIQADELVGFTDSLSILHTFTDVLTVVPAVQDRQGHDVTIKGEPYTLKPLEQFSTLTVTPAAGGLSLTDDCYITQVLGGVLARGVTS